ncbi:hypothetical protein GF314_04210 [bacterium]|nr:hypothetical protein [bacterium]
MKKLALFALALPLALLIHACTDAGDPYIPDQGDVTADVQIMLTDLVGDWDNLHVNGDLTGDTPVAMTQDGIMWSATVSDVAPGDYTYGIYYDDGAKALQPVLTDQSVTVTDGGGVEGTTEVTVEPAAGTGFNLVVINNNPAYENIKIKGEMNEWANEITGSSSDGMYWYLHVDAGLAEGDYEWGVIEDDGSEFGIWLLPPGPNLSFSVDAEGVVTGTTEFVIPSPQPVVNLTFVCDMNDYNEDFDVVQVRGSFNGWSDNPTAMEDQGDGTYAVTVEVEQNEEVIFKFLHDGATYEDVPSDCGVDDGFGGFNRSFTVGTEDVTFTAPWGGCPAK